MVKGLPLAYNRDLQEDKAMLFDAVDTARDSLEISARVVRTMKVNPQRMRAATAQGFLTATDLAEELVRRGAPFSAAHEQVGKLVKACVEKGITFNEISDTDAREVLPGWNSALRKVATSPERALAQKNVVGGTAPGQVTKQIRAAQQTLAKLKRANKR